jgi:phosphoglucomutase
MKRSDIFEDVKTMDFEEAKEAGFITILGEEMDEKYLARVLEQSASAKAVQDAADFKLIFTPLHGTGYKLVPEVLKRLGAKNIITVPEQMVIDGDFPTVGSPNPDNIGTFGLAIELAKQHDANLIIGTDPDGDRCGAVVRNGDEFVMLSGNQIGVLLLDYLIQAKREAGTLAANSAAVKSVVSTIMANVICEKNNVTAVEVLTGFKYIGEKIKEWEANGEHTFLFGFEESNGYLAGTYARDKDAIVASMLIAEMGCMYYLQGKNLYQAMQELYARYGFYKEGTKSVAFEGVDGTEKMGALMDGLRKDPPAEIGLPVLRVRDYQTGDITTLADGSIAPTGLPASNVLFYDLEDGCSAIIRPTGTEPKVKLYVMAKGADAEDVAARFDQINQAGVALLQA